MKKLKLNLSNLVNAEILTREQLKKVIGGEAAETTLPKCFTFCGYSPTGYISCPSGCSCSITNVTNNTGVCK